jgi:hypothetical protein
MVVITARRADGTELSWTMRISEGSWPWSRLVRLGTGCRSWYTRCSSPSQTAASLLGVSRPPPPSVMTDGPRLIVADANVYVDAVVHDATKVLGDPPSLTHIPSLPPRTVHSALHLLGGARLLQPRARGS